MAGAELVVEHVPAVVHCRAVRASTRRSTGPCSRARACESHDVELRAGDELELAWIDVAEEVG